MKKTLIMTIVWFLFTALPMQAQWNIGGLLNIGSTTVKVDPDPSSEEYSSRFGFGMGVVLDRPLTGQIDLHAEPMFLQKGSQIDDRGDDVTFKMSYFELPVMFRYNFQLLGTAVPYALAGPSLGYLTGAKFEVGGSEFEVKDEFKSFDFGIGFGGGAKIPKENLELFAEARYLLGLANVNDDESDGTTVRNRGVHVVFGFTVPLNGL